MRIFTESDNYNDKSEKTVGIAQTVTGTSVSIVPRIVQTQQTVELSMTGMDTGANKNITIIIDPPTGTGNINFTKITPQTNNTDINEMYVFLLSDDAFAFLHLGDYQDFLDKSMPTEVNVAFMSSLQKGGSLRDPLEGYQWGRFLTFSKPGRTIRPFTQTQGSSQESLTTVDGSNEYNIVIDPLLLSKPDGSVPFLKLVEIATSGPIKIKTPNGVSQKVWNLNINEFYSLLVFGPGIVNVVLKLTPGFDTKDFGENGDKGGGTESPPNGGNGDKGGGTESPPNGGNNNGGNGDQGGGSQSPAS